MLKLVIATTLLTFGFLACNQQETIQETILQTDSVSVQHLLHDITARHENGDLNVVIEIPAGTLEKWEVNKTTGQLELEHRNGQPRIIQYIGYPGNYGFIPQTLLPKEAGGDGDPLDVLVLGAPVKRGTILKSKLIGVLHLLDGGEQDDKLIAVSEDSPLYNVNSIAELDSNYEGITESIAIWFSNYKGPGKMESLGFGSKDTAIQLFEYAVTAYQPQ